MVFERANACGMIEGYDVYWHFIGRELKLNIVADFIIEVDLIKAFKF